MAPSRYTYFKGDQDFIIQAFSKYAHQKQETDKMLEQLIAPYITGSLSVLDAGCAFGRDTAEFKASGLIPVGIDLSDELLRKAVTSHPDIRFQKMDVRKLSFDDHSFDGIWCHAVLLHLKDDGIITALREFHRVLKPGGILFISFKKGEGAREVVEDFSSNSARFFNYKTTEAVMEMLQRTGFTDIDAYYINERDLFGPDKRDLDWVHCFSKNASQQSPA